MGAGSQSFTWDHVLYRLFDADGALLYVGITNDMRRRFQAHRWESSWWDDVVDCRVELLPSDTALRKAEQRAIHDEDPLHNKERYHRLRERWAAEALASATAIERQERAARASLPVSSPGSARRFHLTAALGMGPPTFGPAVASKRQT